MLFKDEVLEVIRNHGDEYEVKVLVTTLLETLKSECQLLKVTLGLLADSDLMDKETKIEQLKEVLLMKADQGIEISGAMLEHEE